MVINAPILTAATVLQQVREPPTITGSFGSWTDGFFNLTMTYRMDSEIDFRWAKVVTRESVSTAPEAHLSATGKQVGICRIKMLQSPLKSYASKGYSSCKSSSITKSYVRT